MGKRTFSKDYNLQTIKQAVEEGKVRIAEVSTEKMTLPISVFSNKELSIFCSRNSNKLFLEVIEIFGKKRLHPKNLSQIISCLPIMKKR